jgi:hypothetical protein
MTDDMSVVLQLPEWPVKFWLGTLSFTAGANRDLERKDIIAALNRHHRGDWGDVCPNDRAANDEALATGGRLFSAYHDRKGVKFWVITEADRSATTVLLPSDY